MVVLALVFSLGAVAVLMVGTVGASPGTDYYVNATTGNDTTGDGSASQPWKTITKAVGCVPAGTLGDPNIVHVAAGTYDVTNNGESFTINFNNAHVTLSGAGAASTIIDGENSATILQVNADDITIDGFTITNASPGDGIYIDLVENAIISHNTITYDRYGVYINNSNDCEISHNSITDNDWDGIYLENSNHNTITDNSVCRNQQSCPFVYSWDGQEYRLDSFPFTGAASQALEKIDYDNLEYLTPADGKYLLKITEELSETTYVNELKLIVTDHPSGTQIIPDRQGNIHTIRALYAPIAGEEEDGTDCLDQVTARDGIYWTSNMVNKNFSEEEDLRDGIILTFEKPEDAEIAKVAVNFLHTDLCDYITTSLHKFKSVVPELPEALRGLIDPLIMSLVDLHLEVWNGTEWVSEGTFPGPGAYIARDAIQPIDVSGIEGDTIRIKLESSTGLVRIDWVGMDYSADEAVINHELSATTAVDADGIDVAPQMLANDGDYLILKQGDCAYLSFDEIAANPAYARSYIVKVKGYYEPAIAAGEAQEELLEKFLTDFPYAARYLLQRYYSPHSGIHLVDSSNNTISGNDICDNLGDGIYLGNSDSNQIVNSDIHGNWHGIFIDASDNNTIRCNNITGNVLVDSGVHVAADSSGNVANCNNIEDNGPYGVWNDPTNPTLDAINNWWGHVSGPSGVGLGSGDAVSENVTYAPWLPTQFQYCLKCVGGPVGGEAYPINKLAILMPWIALGAAIVAVASLVLKRRRA